MARHGTRGGPLGGRPFALYCRMAITKNRKAVLERDNHICQYCGFPADTTDHLVPRSYILDTSMDNQVAACRTCNSFAVNMIFSSFEEKREYILKRRRDRRLPPPLKV